MVKPAERAVEIELSCDCHDSYLPVAPVSQNVYAVFERPAQAVQLPAEDCGDLPGGDVSLQALEAQMRVLRAREQYLTIKPGSYVWPDKISRRVR